MVSRLDQVSAAGPFPLCRACRVRGVFRPVDRLPKGAAPGIQSRVESEDTHRIPAASGGANRRGMRDSVAAPSSRALIACEARWLTAPSACSQSPSQAERPSVRRW